MNILLYLACILLLDLNVNSWSAERSQNLSSHDAWCGRIDNSCKVLFKKGRMWIAGNSNGIYSNQYISYRYDRLRGEHSHEHVYANYLRYFSSSGQEKQALFLFVNGNAQRKFAEALFFWRNYK